MEWSADTCRQNLSELNDVLQCVSAADIKAAAEPTAKMPADGMPADVTSANGMPTGGTQQHDKPGDVLPSDWKGLAKAGTSATGTAGPPRTLRWKAIGPHGTAPRFKAAGPKMAAKKSAAKKPEVDSTEEIIRLLKVIQDQNRDRLATPDSIKETLVKERFIILIPRE